MGRIALSGFLLQNCNPPVTLFNSLQLTARRLRDRLMHSPRVFNFIRVDSCKDLLRGQL